MRWVICFLFGFACICATAADNAATLLALKDYLNTPQKKLTLIQQLDFSKVKLSKSDADTARELLWRDHLLGLAKERANEMKTKVIHHGKFALRFEYFVYGKIPKNGRSLFISMHGGGNAPARVNDSQWNNQKRL